MREPRALVHEIEELIHDDVGRNISPLFLASKGGLWNAAMSLSSDPALKVGLITGFYIPNGSPPCAETDGVVGVALLVRAFSAVNIPCRIATDAPCYPACHAALIGAGVGDAPIDAIDIGDSTDQLIASWRRIGISRVISVERCGRSADGRPRNMRGVDISLHTAPLDELFLAGPWDTIAIGDGGNEIGMGALPRRLIAEHVLHGARIASTIPATHLVVAGVSNWGAYALLGALAAIREDWRPAMIKCLEPKLDRTILEAAVYNGPSVDGVSGKQALSVDNIPMEDHHKKLTMIRKLVDF